MNKHAHILWEKWRVNNAMYTVFIIPLTHWWEAHYLRIHASSSHKQNERLHPINTATVVKMRGEMVPLYTVAHQIRLVAKLQDRVTVAPQHS
jgi:hypothetical protein